MLKSDWNHIPYERNIKGTLLIYWTSLTHKKNWPWAEGSLFHVPLCDAPRDIESDISCWWRSSLDISGLLTIRKGDPTKLDQVSADVQLEPLQVAPSDSQPP